MLERNPIAVTPAQSLLLVQHSWIPIQELILERGLLVVYCAQDPLHRRRPCSYMWECTLARGHTAALHAVNHSVDLKHWKDIHWLTQGRNRITVYYVVSRLQRLINWMFTEEFIQERPLTVVPCVRNPSPDRDSFRSTWGLIQEIIRTNVRCARNRLLDLTA